MPRYNQDEVFVKIAGTRLLPIFNDADLDLCKNLLSSCYEAGIRSFELTNRDPEALKIFRALVPFIEKELPELTFGAGTILNGEMAKAFIEAGADYIIAPTMDQDTAQVCVSYGIPWIPGCFTTTEIHQAYKWGAQLIKLFPAGSVGPAYLKHILAPLPFVKAVVTGGVKLDEASVKSWLHAGVFAMGVGSQLFSKEMIAARDFQGLTSKLRVLVGYASG